MLKRAGTHTTAGLSSPVIIPPVVVSPHPEAKAAREEAASAPADVKGAKTSLFGGRGSYQHTTNFTIQRYTSVKPDPVKNAGSTNEGT